MDTIVYIDGFNLYYRALKGTPHRWCDIHELAKLCLPGHNITKVKYFTARVSGRLDTEAPKNQHVYLRALALNPLIEIIYGNFLTNAKWAGICNDLNDTIRPKPEVAYVWKTEEKGSDVNLAAHLLVDTFRGRMQQAAVLTNDSDLCEPIRMARQEFGMRVTLLMPSSKPSKGLRDAATAMRHISPYIGPARLPDPVMGGKKPLFKPAKW